MARNTLVRFAVVVIAVAVCLLQALPAAAHDLWTEPERYAPGSGQEMRPAVAHLMIGRSEQYQIPDDQYLFKRFPRVGFVFDSEENVQKNYEGSHFYRLR